MTAVEWLENMIAKMEAYGGDLPPLMIHIQKAKEMEKEQGYSEEEVLTILHKRDMYKWEEHLEVLSLNEWFNKFKKK